MRKKCQTTRYKYKKLILDTKTKIKLPKITTYTFKMYEIISVSKNSECTMYFNQFVLLLLLLVITYIVITGWASSQYICLLLLHFISHYEVTKHRQSHQNITNWFAWCTWASVICSSICIGINEGTGTGIGKDSGSGFCCGGWCCRDANPLLDPIHKLYNFNVNSTLKRGRGFN